MCLPSLLVDGCSFLRCHTDLLIGPLWNSYMLGLSSWLNKDVIQLLVLPCIASLPIGWNCRVKSVTYVVVVARVPNLGQMVWEWVSILCFFFFSPDKHRGKRCLFFKNQQQLICCVVCACKRRLASRQMSSSWSVSIIKANSCKC